MEEIWKLPRVLRIEGDGRDPRKTRLLDAETEEVLRLPVHSLTFHASADTAPEAEIVLAGMSIRADVHGAIYRLEEEDLRTLAEQNGFLIQRATTYPARIVKISQHEMNVFFRHLPDLVVPIPLPMHNQKALRLAGGALHEHLRILGSQINALPAPDEAREDEVLISAIPYREPEF